MKTIFAIRKNILSKLIRALMFVALVSFGFKASAQCTAGYTFIVDPANNGDVAFTNTSSAGTGLNYYWSFGDGNYSTLLNPGIHTYASTGTYTACLTIYDSLGMFDSTLGCYNTFCNTIAVINPTGTSSCIASFIAFDSIGYGYFINTSAVTGLTSSWSFGDGTSGTSTGDITHLYASPGTYIVCLTISNFLGTCTDTFCDSITIGSGSTGSCMGIVNPIFTYSESAGLASFSNTPSGSSPIYFWDFGDGTSSSTVGNNSHLYTANGTYLVCLTVYETGGGTDSCQYCNYVTISGLTSCDATFNIIQDSTNLFNYFIYNTAALAAGTTYFWDFGDGTTSTLQYPSHTYSITYPVMICLTISTGPACTATYCDSINPGHTSGTFTINVLPLGVQEQTSIVSSFENYPNPFSDNTTINYSINKDANVSIVIVDLLGNKIAELENGNKTGGNYSTTWNASSVAEGMYLLQLKVNNTVSTKKIIVNR